MGRPPLTLEEREQLRQCKLRHMTVRQAASEVRCSWSTARKWYRRLQREGLEGLNRSRRGRRKTGGLSRFDHKVADKALLHKTQHPGWGPKRVRIELQRDPELEGLRIPHASRLAIFFKEHCPECVVKSVRSQDRPPHPPLPSVVHEIWQLDAQEGIALQDGDIATICNVREPVGGAILASRAFSVKTEAHWRKLTPDEVRSVLRAAFAEWGTVPDAVQTDNELGLAGCPTDPFPGLLTLWLEGLGIKHIFIRPGCPTDQPQIERCHRTLDNMAVGGIDLANRATLQASLDRERKCHNEEYPSTASDCGGKPPLEAHPELRRPRRPYAQAYELLLFDMQRVANYLAGLSLHRKVNASGQISLGKRLYSVGRSHAKETVAVRFGPKDRVWIVSQASSDNASENMELCRLAPKGLDATTVMGLSPENVQTGEAIQLTFLIGANTVWLRNC